MNTQRDVTRIVRSWLLVDEHESADRVLETVLSLLETTPQRRSRWPARRIAEMNTFAKLAIAAAAVVVVALVGINLLPARGGISPGGPVVTPSPSPSPSPSPTPLAAVFPPRGPLEIGRHSITQVGVSYSFAVPTSGWISNGTFALDRAEGVAPDGAGFIFWGETPVGVFADPCEQTKGPLIGGSAADLAAAVATVPGTELVDGPTDVMVGGHPAKRVVLVIHDDVGCTAGSFRLWYTSTPGLSRFATQLGSKIRVWIIDVDGTLIWIDGETFKGSGPEPGRQIQQIIDSIEFE
jgi:hypothetical protein